MSMICLKHFLHISLEGTRAFLWDSETWRTSLNLLEMVIPISFPDEFPWPDPSRPSNKRECGHKCSLLFIKVMEVGQLGHILINEKWCVFDKHTIKVSVISSSLELPTSTAHLTAGFFWTFRKKLKPKKNQANFRKTQANHSKTQ